MSSSSPATNATSSSATHQTTPPSRNNEGWERSQSPSSVRWHLQDYYHYKRQKKWQDRPESLGSAWQIPCQKEMKRKWQFRQTIAEETLQHRRIENHSSCPQTRPMLSVLRDRQVYGSQTRKHVSMMLVKKKKEDTSSGATTTRSTTSTAGRPQEDDSYYYTTQMTTRRCTDELQTLAESASVRRYHSAFLSHLGGQSSSTSQNNTDERQPQASSSSAAVSTISIAFSPDSLTMASTHGDHTVKITHCGSGHLAKVLEGHPRTPWTVKYHPHNPAILASGCLGHQVRIWDWKQGLCLEMVRLDFAIISVSFHPSGSVLAVANGTRLHFWAWNHPEEQQLQQTRNTSEKARPPSLTDGTTTSQDEEATRTENNPSNNPTTAGANNHGQTRNDSSSRPDAAASNTNNNPFLMLEVEQRHMLRCVHFPPNGTTLIVGGVNPSPTQPEARPRRGGISGGGMSFYLRLWDFDLSMALQQQPPPTSSTAVRRRLLSNPRTFVPRVLLYNDGGFDVSPDGKTLCCCAEYWLPNGVNNAKDYFPSTSSTSTEAEEEDSGGNVNNATTDGDDDKTEVKGDEADERSTADAATPRSDANAAVPMTTPISGTESMDASVQSTSDGGMDTDVASASRDANMSSSSSPPRPPLADSGWRTPQPPMPPPQPLLSTPVGSFASTTPHTPPPIQGRSAFPLSPPSPPGRRFPGGLSSQTRGRNQSSSSSQSAFTIEDGGTGQGQAGDDTTENSTTRGLVGAYAASRVIPPPRIQGSGTTGARGRSGNSSGRPHNPYPMQVGEGGNAAYENGRFVPHVVTISMETAPAVNDLVPGRNPYYQPGQGQPCNISPVLPGTRPRLGHLLEACPLDGAKASAVTCVKFSPGTHFCLIGYGVRETMFEHNGNRFHPVAALYRIRGGMTHISTMSSGDDDVNIARFHPDSGYGFVYGTKQGRVRVLSPRPWNYYNC